MRSWKCAVSVVMSLLSAPGVIGATEPERLVPLARGGSLEFIPVRPIATTKYAASFNLSESSKPVSLGDLEVPSCPPGQRPALRLTFNATIPSGTGALTLHPSNGQSDLNYLLDIQTSTKLNTRGVKDQNTISAYCNDYNDTLPAQSSDPPSDSSNPYLFLPSRLPVEPGHAALADDANAFVWFAERHWKPYYK
ncbi:hypothetical protein NUU61_001609 [Penicillium alfredii]|uniref:Uncharacterized protein n=1 Tax=Penicillium alfredii TaxID=1506179 RepID=A0A9W9G1I3_9EURO|nr:uncharacterized protein NUU61_001609 [Penicillium alfredii]KAJ5110352.1 hypothetical protein NUU61_001609 [Penicillium alfredii]